MTTVSPTIRAKGLLCNEVGEYLVLERAKDGDWDFPGGKIVLPELAHDALVREFCEETGLEVSSACCVYASTQYRERDTHYNLVLLYQVVVSDTSAIVLSDEHTSFKRVDKGFLLNDLSSNWVLSGLLPYLFSL